MYKKYIKRFALCILGLALYGFGCVLGVKAGDAGTNAWSTLALGFGSKSGLSYGTATFLISLVIITVDILGKGKLGFGTFLNLLLIPIFSDIFLAMLAIVPDAQTAVGGAALSLLGQTVISFATVVYMLPALGAGPRDTLLVIIGRKLPKIPIGAVKFGIEMAVLLIGVLLGAPLGLGTVLVLVLQASIFQLVCRLCRFEPRSIVQENVFDTLKILLHR